MERPNEGRYWLNHRQEVAAALEGASFLGDPNLSPSVLHVLRNNPGVRKSSVWKTLLTLGGPLCLEEMIGALGSGDYHECIENLGSFDPAGLSQEESRVLESQLSSIKMRRRSDRIQVLRMLSRIEYEPEEGTVRRLLDMTSATEDAWEFEALLETLQARRIPPRGYDLARVVDRLSRGTLKLSRKAVVSMLRWASTGKYSVSRTYLEELLRHASREVRTAAARAVIALARRQRDRE
jgi:hypothetical protein